MEPTVRLLLAGVLLVAAVALGVHYDVAGPPYPYPGPTEVATDYDEHVGSAVFLFAAVESVDRGRTTARVEVGHAAGTLGLTVSNFDAPAVRPGGTVQVYGILRPDARIDATNVVVVNPTASTDHEKYLLSAVGGVLVLVVFFRRWTVDTEALGFVPR